MKAFIENFEYVPLILLTLLTLRHKEIDGELMAMTFKFAVMTVILAAFYMMVAVYNVPKGTALVISALVWVLAVYVKRCYIHPKPKRVSN